MDLLKRLSCSLILILWLGEAFSQTFNLQQKADDDFANNNFKLALDNYMKIYDKKPDNTAVIEKITLCNIHLHNFNDAATWSDQLLKQEPNNKIYKLVRAKALLSLGQYIDAKAAFLDYLSSDPTEEKSVNLYVQTCDSGLKWSKNPNPNIIVENVKALNTPDAEFGLTPFGRGYMFSSDRKTEETKILASSAGKKGDEPAIFGFTGRPYLKLYYVNATGDTSWDQPSYFAKLLGEKFHTSSASYDKKNNILYFTRTRKLEAPKSFSKAVFRTELVYSEAFREIKPFPFNSPLSYSVGDPCISSDGKRLYFVSGKPGGKGGSDIYFSDQNKDGIWQEPVNLGDRINTPNEERYPTLYNDSTLFFASDGHLGMGGLDIFSSKLQKDGTWTKPINLGVPYNSAQDDYDLIITNYQKISPKKTLIQGFFSSDRIGGLGSDDIYSFRSGELPKPKPPVEILKPNDTATVAKGTLTDQSTGEGIAGVNLAVNEVNKKEVSNYETDAKGAFAFPVKKSKKYAVRFKKPKFFTKTDTISVSDKGDPIEIKEKFTKIELDKPVRLDNIYYGFNNWTITSESSVVLNGLVSMMNQNQEISIQISSHTDTRGDNGINNYVSQKRAEAVVNYLVSKGIDAKRLSAKGYGKQKPIVPCGVDKPCTEEDHAINRRTEFQVVKIAE